MATLTHPTMRKVSTIEQPSSGAIIVDDLSAFGGQTETEVKIPEQKVFVQHETKKIIEDLIFAGKTTKTVEAAGHKFEISTLSHKEHNQLMASLAQIGESANILKIRIYTLAMTVRKIDEIKFDDISFEGEFNSIFEKKVEFLDNMQVRLVEQLFDEYAKMLDETDKIVTGEAIKK